MTVQYVVATLAPPRRRWVSALSRWATTGALPVDVLACLAGDELRALLGTGRALSLVLVDAGSAGLDRDLVAAVVDAGCDVVVVDDGAHRRDWEALGCAEVVEPADDPSTVAELLARRGRRGGTTARRAARSTDLGRPASPSTVVAVTGTGGAGSSTVAAAVAQSLGSPPGRRVRAALVDGTRRSTQTVLHAPDDVVPNLADLVDAHRNDSPDPEVVRGFLHPVPQRGYDLLLGLRRTRDWAGQRPLALCAALDAVTHAYDYVVVDHDPDVDGMASTGSVEVEERHALARWSVDRADLVLVVARNDLAGLHALAAVRADLHDHGVAPERLLVVLNRVRGGTARRVDVGLRRAVGSPFVALPHVPAVELAHRAATPLPRRLVQTVGAATSDALRRVQPRAPRERSTRLLPGELGTHVGGAFGGEAA